VKIFRWIVGTVITAALLAAIAAYGVTMFERLFWCLSVSLLAALWRAFRGPTNFDRLLAFNAGNIIVTGFCAILSIALKKDIYIDIAIAWLLQNYVITLALTKYLEGRELDD
jgi:multicomponent Na+:H+ antiporter subunit F